MGKKANIVTEAEGAEVFVRMDAGEQDERKKPAKKKIILVIAVIAAVVTAAGALASRGGAEPVVAVSAASVERMDLEQTVSVRGTIQGSDSADVASSLNYKITAIHVREGDAVQRNQVLATLDTSELQDQYNKALLARSESKRAVDSAEILYEEGAMSRDEYLRLKAVYENDELTVASFDIGEKRNIRSPIAGTVTRVNVSIGRYASETENRQAMFVVENLKDLQMRVNVSEYDISKIKVGQDVTITAEVLGSESVKGTVSKISPTGEPKEPGSSEKVIPVVIEIEPGAELIAGVTARATILIERREMALAVPVDAILEDPETGEARVLVVEEEGILKEVPVTLGLEGNLYVEIVGGALAEGDQIVLAPTFDLRDGDAVSVNEPM